MAFRDDDEFAVVLEFSQRIYKTAQTHEATIDALSDVLEEMLDAGDDKVRQKMLGILRARLER
jgi:hypothetical protein